MAKVRFQGEWKMWVGFGGLCVLVVLYLYFISRPPMEGGEYLWQVKRIVDPKRLVLTGSGKTIQFVLAGIDVPESEAQAARDLLTQTLQDKWVRLKPLGKTPAGDDAGFVLLSGEDMHARMIRQGLARIDRNEKDFDVRPYIELEMEAKKERRGLWGRPGQGGK
ncbi:MAG: thermonuclease family protein [Desulfomonile sp.]|nr:thermonuclease family protein [Desulfomonile sp.]